MIRHLLNHEIDRTLWDGCISNALNHRIYGYSWYLDLVCNDWNALVLDDYRAVFPLPFRRKAGLRYVYTPFFVQQLGLFCTLQDQFNLVDDFIYFIRKKYVLADIYLQEQAFPTRYAVAARNTYMLPLAEAYPVLSARYSDNLKRNLRNAQKHNLRVLPHADSGAVIAMFRMGRGAGINHWHETDYQRFRRLFHDLEHRGHARAWGAYTPSNQLIAGVIFFFDRKHAILIFSGVSEEGKEKSGIPLIIDTVIREITGGEMVLDFEGSMDPGLARFYNSFGASAQHYWFLRTGILSFLKRM